MVDYDAYDGDIAHHVLKVLRPLHTAKRELDFLNRYVGMRDAGVPRYRVTEGQLDRIDDVLVQIRGAFSDLEILNRRPD